MKIQTTEQKKTAIANAVKAQIIERTAYMVAYDGDDGINGHAVQGKAAALKGAYSTAVFKVGGFITTTKAGRVTSTKKPGSRAFMDKVAKALKHWYTTTKSHPVLIDKNNVMLPAGQVFAQNRLADKGPAFNTGIDLVQPFVDMIKTGKPVDIKGYTAKPIKPRMVTYQETK